MTRLEDVHGNVYCILRLRGFSREEALVRLRNVEWRREQAAQLMRDGMTATQAWVWVADYRGRGSRFPASMEG